MDIGRTDHLGLGGEDRQLPVGADLALGNVCVCVRLLGGSSREREGKMKGERAGAWERRECVTQPAIS